MSLKIANFICLALKGLKNYNTSLTKNNHHISDYSLPVNAKAYPSLGNQNK